MSFTNIVSRIDSGSTVVAMGLNASPWVAAYRFRVATGWGSRYSNPSPSIAFSSECRAASFAVDNSRLLVAGAGASVYSAPWTESGGYGTGSTILFTARSVSFNGDGSKLLVSATGTLSEYDFSSSGLGSLVASRSFGGVGRYSKYILDGNYAVISFGGDTAMAATYVKAGSSFNQVSQINVSGTDVTSFSMSPIAHSGTRVLAMVDTNNAVLRLYPVNTTTGVFGSAISVTVGSNVGGAVFDSRGRLFVGYTSGNLLRIYTLNSSGAQTLAATASGFSGGAINYLSYDDISDVLFVASASSPHITAYPIGGSGFGTKYPDPSSAVGSSVIAIGLQNGDSWKSDRVN